MIEVRYNKIALILVVLIALFILVFPPFVSSIYVPVLGRVVLFFIIVSFSISTVIKKKYFIIYYLPVSVFFIISGFYWITAGTVFAEMFLLLLYFFLAIALLTSVNRNKSLKTLLINFYFILIVVLSVLSVLSFLAFNLEIVPYGLKPLGEGDDIYMYYHNYFLGYINYKDFESGAIGRVCGFLFEPSYQGWFLSTNFFLISKFVEKKKYLILIQLIVFLGALSSFSTMSWIVFSIVFTSMFCFKLMSILGLNKKISNILYVIMLLTGTFAMFTIVNQDKLLEMVGPSSSDDRSARADVSFLYLTTASSKELFLGRGPGFIGKNSDRGESNPIIKSLVENGIITTVLVLVFIVYCTHRSKFYMIATLLWLNSVVILFTPLFIINVLVCRWMDESE